jgi:hypothetical protein
MSPGSFALVSFAQLRNKSWKSECVLSFKMDWRILGNHHFLIGGSWDLKKKKINALVDRKNN